MDRCVCPHESKTKLLENKDTIDSVMRFNLDSGLSGAVQDVQLLQDSVLYIGYSTDLRRRLGEHKEGASRATSHRGPWNLIYYEAYSDESDAAGRERYLKSGGGRKLLRSQLRNYFAKYPLRTA